MEMKNVMGAIGSMCWVLCTWALLYSASISCQRGPSTSSHQQSTKPNQRGSLLLQFNGLFFGFFSFWAFTKMGMYDWASKFIITNTTNRMNKIFKIIIKNRTFLSNFQVHHYNSKIRFIFRKCSKNKLKFKIDYSNNRLQVKERMTYLTR